MKWLWTIWMPLKNTPISNINTLYSCLVCFCKTLFSELGENFLNSCLARYCLFWLYGCVNLDCVPVHWIYCYDV